MESVTFAGIRIGVDLAISQRDTADYTSMVSGWICWEKDSDDYSIYVLPDPINKKMTFPETVDTCKDLHKAYVASDSLPEFVIEDVAYQRALPQQLEMVGLEVMPMRPGNQDKRSRLALTTHKIKRGKILFPKEGCEELLSQLIHFGVEKHDDLADGFSMMVLSTFEEIPSVPDIYFLGEGGHDDYDEDDDDYDYVVGLY
jgi:predicted phage terminase large subunit-like protein